MCKLTLENIITASIYQPIYTPLILSVVKIWVWNCLARRNTVLMCSGIIFPDPLWECAQKSQPVNVRLNKICSARKYATHRLHSIVQNWEMQSLDYAIFSSLGLSWVGIECLPQSVIGMGLKAYRVQLCYRTQTNHSAEQLTKIKASRCSKRASPVSKRDSTVPDMEWHS